jgi:endothelin-converting enzyme/putative endopeptidase
MSQRLHRAPAALAITAALAALAGLGIEAVHAADTPAPAKAEAEAKDPLGGLPAAIDRKVDPCTDFYRYACGNWLATTTLPSDRTRWARSFSVIAENNRVLLRELLETAAKDPDGGDAEQRLIGTFYGACMDEAAVDARGFEPLRPWLARIDAAKTPAEFLRLAGELQRKGVGAFFGAGVIPDFKQPDQNLVIVAQGGLGMPDRDYYVSDDPEKKKLLEGYRAHAARLLGMIGESEADAKRHADQIVAFETELAKVMRPRAEMRQVDKLYNRTTLAEFQKANERLPLAAFFEASGIGGDATPVNNATPEFFERLQTLLAETPVETLRAYLRWHALDSAAPHLATPFVTADFEFWGKTLRGQAELEPRWKRCTDLTQGMLGEAVGKLYVARQFPGESKDVAVEMVQDIQNAFAENLPELSWMDDATRRRAIEKKAAMRRKIGYPDRWRDYSSMQLKRGSYFENLLEGQDFEHRRQIAKLGQPVDPDEWLITPQTVNAYYAGVYNEIAFPAGILQPPFFHKDFPAAMNYGAIGAVIGHELTHGFDDQGRKFDPRGQMREWWEPAVAERFEKQAGCVRDAYSQFEVAPGVHVNGELTLGENIADIGGVKNAYDAYKAWEKRHGAPPPAVAGMTNDQLFFTAFAQVWCTVQTPESAKLQVTTDPHSPSQFRVNGTLAHTPEFARAFACEEGEPMRPKNVCTVW